jgi:hypothetical protein
MVLVQLFGQATFFIGHQFYLEKWMTNYGHSDLDICQMP